MAVINSPVMGSPPAGGPEEAVARHPARGLQPADGVGPHGGRDLLPDELEGGSPQRPAAHLPPWPDGAGCVQPRGGAHVLLLPQVGGPGWSDGGPSLRYKDGN